MLVLHRSLVVAATAVSVCTTALAQAPDPCSVVPFFNSDATAENLLGIGPGFVGEYCQDLDLEPLVSGPDSSLCTADGLYFVVEVITGLTYHVDAPHPVFGDVRVRRALELSSDRLMSQDDIPRGTPPSFPSYQQTEDFPYDAEAAAALLEEAGWVMGDDGIHVCQGWDGSDGNQAIPADVGEGSVNDINVTFDDGQLWERLQDFPGFEDYRAVLAGIQIAPIGGALTGEQVVPPPVEVSSDQGMVAVWGGPAGGAPYTFRLRHRVAAPISAELRQGRFGENGPLLADLGNPASPIEVNYDPPSLDEFARLLREGKLYVQVNGPGGSAIRSNLAFARRRIVDLSTYSVRLGLSHPASPNCYAVHHSGDGDEIAGFDMVGEDLRPFANGTLPRVDELEMPRGGPIFSFKVGISVDKGPAELFPSGFSEPGTGTPLTDGCILLGVEDPIDASNFAGVLEAELTTYSDGTPTGPPIDVESAIEWYREGNDALDPWKMDALLYIPNAAGQGVDGVRFESTLLEGIFGDGFRSPNTDAWDLTVGGP